MKTLELLNLLQEHQDKSLLFEFEPGRYVATNYHITEIKNVMVDSVDCGARPDFWRETVIQLWESPEEKENHDHMKAYKALGILKKVDRIKTMDRNAVVRFEYGNDNFHTAQLFVNDVTFTNSRLIIKLATEKTDCKAKDVCVASIEEGAKHAQRCTPESGCC